MTQKDELELKAEQHVRLLSVFHNILTYDGREKVISLCEATFVAGPKLFSSKD